MEATLLSSQMLMEVDGLLVKTGEVLHGFALPFSDPLYGALPEPSGAVDAIAPRAEGIFHPELLKDMQCFGVWIRQNRGTIHFASG